MCKDLVELNKFLAELDEELRQLYQQFYDVSANQINIEDDVIGETTEDS